MINSCSVAFPSLLSRTLKSTFFFTPKYWNIPRFASSSYLSYHQDALYCKCNQFCFRSVIFVICHHNRYTAIPWQPLQRPGISVFLVSSYYWKVLKVFLILISTTDLQPQLKYRSDVQWLLMVSIFFFSLQRTINVTQATKYRLRIKQNKHQL